VSTVLAILTRAAPEEFQGCVNTQDPVSWSDALRPFGMKLAFCPTDVRKVKFYVPELLALNDLFTVSYFTTGDPQEILEDPGGDGWVCHSHVVVVHCDSVLDPATGELGALEVFPRVECHTKRIFRVVPVEHPRGL